MSRKIIMLIAVLAIGLLALAACGGQDEPAAESAAAPTAAAVEESADEEVAEEDAEATEDSSDAVGDAADAEATEAPAEESAEAATGMRHFVIVPAESTASYLVDEEFLGGVLDKLGIAAGEVDVIGSTQEVTGEFEIDVANGAVGANEFTVQIDTLSTDQDRRDNWVRNREPAFAQFPVAIFTATSIDGAPTEYADGQEVTFQLVGDLAVRDTIVPTTFEVTATLDGDTITGVAIADLLLSDFGINPPNFANTLTVQDAFQVKMALTAVEK